MLSAVHEQSMIPSNSKNEINGSQESEITATATTTIDQYNDPMITTATNPNPTENISSPRRNRTKTINDEKANMKISSPTAVQRKQRHNKYKAKVEGDISSGSCHQEKEDLAVSSNISPAPDIGQISAPRRTRSTEKDEKAQLKISPSLAVIQRKRSQERHNKYQEQVARSITAGSGSQEQEEDPIISDNNPPDIGQSSSPRRNRSKTINDEKANMNISSPVTMQRKQRHDKYKAKIEGDISSGSCHQEKEDLAVSNNIPPAPDIGQISAPRRTRSSEKDEKAQMKISPSLAVIQRKRSQERHNKYQEQVARSITAGSGSQEQEEDPIISNNKPPDIGQSSSPRRNWSKTPNNDEKANMNISSPVTMQRKQRHDKYQSKIEEDIISSSRHQEEEDPRAVSNATASDVGQISAPRRIRSKNTEKDEKSNLKISPSPPVIQRKRSHERYDKYQEKLKRSISASDSTDSSVNLPQSFDDVDDADDENLKQQNNYIQNGKDHPRSRQRHDNNDYYGDDGEIIVVDDDDDDDSSFDESDEEWEFTPGAHAVYSDEVVRRSRNILTFMSRNSSCMNNTDSIPAGRKSATGRKSVAGRKSVTGRKSVAGRKSVDFMDKAMMEKEMEKDLEGNDKNNNFISTEGNTVDVKADATEKSRFRFYLLLLSIPAVIGIIIFVILYVMKEGDDKSDDLMITESPTTSIPITPPTLEPTPEVSINIEPYAQVLSVISNENDLLNIDTPQYKAMLWIAKSYNNIVDEVDILMDQELIFNILQRYLIVLIYYSTNGEQWNNQYKFLTKSLHECDWNEIVNEMNFGISCNSDDKIVSIALAANNLDGSIPSEISFLSNTLHMLDLGRNNIRGTIPTEIGDLSNMQVFSIYAGKITETIPSEIGRLERLQYLVLGSNSFTGELPTEIGQLTDLKRLDFQSNRISGLITELGTLSSLEVMIARGNSLEGAMPSELGGLTNLQVINLSHNYLSGTIPAEIGNLSNLRTLDVGYNYLSGIIPNEVGTLSNLEIAKFGENDFFGDLDSLFCNNRTDAEFLEEFSADCDEITCTCCTECCSYGTCLQV